MTLDYNLHFLLKFLLTAINYRVIKSQVVNSLVVALVNKLLQSYYAI